MKKRIVWPLIGSMAAALLLTAAAFSAIKPLPAVKCTISTATFNSVTHHVTVTKKGSGCFYWVVTKTAKGKKIVKPVPTTGQKWSYLGLTVKDSHGITCGVAKAAGAGNSFVLQAQAAMATATVTFRVYVAQNKYHQAGKPVTKTFTVRVGGTNSAACNGTSNASLATLTPGQASAADLPAEASCGLVNHLQPATYDGVAVQFPQIGCVAGGQCTWHDYAQDNIGGVSVYRTELKCEGTGFYLYPTLAISIKYPDHTLCNILAGDLASYPLSQSSFQGTMLVGVSLQAGLDSTDIDLPEPSNVTFSGTGPAGAKIDCSGTGMYPGTW